VDDSEFEQLLVAVPALTSEQHQRLGRALQQWSEARPVIEQANDRLDDAPLCPHCQSTEIQRWGRSGGLQRYRCKQCRKTFNPLTGTPLARLRKREQWPAFSETLAEGSTVQQAAEHCGVDPSTSFRWRHRFLEALQDNEAVTLTGLVEVAEIRFTHADKGARDLQRPARRRGGHQHRGFTHPEESVLLLLDRSGSATELSLPADGDGGLARLGHERVADDALLCGSDDAGLREALTALGLARQLRAPVRVDGVVNAVAALHENPSRVFNRDRVDAYVLELQAWMQRFNGVNSRYLANYLRWCRLLLQEENNLSGSDLVFRLLR